MPQTELTDHSFEQEVLKNQAPVMVDFWAPWCGPCRMLSPVVEEIAKEYEARIKVAKINTDEHPMTAAKYKISAIPSLLFFKNGQVVEQLIGVHPKSEIKKKLESLLG